MTNEQKIELCNQISKNIKNKDSYLIENDKDFIKLINSKLLTFNNKIGSKYSGYWLSLFHGKDKDTDNYVIKISKNSGLPIAFYLELLNERLAAHCGLSAIESKIFKYKKDSNIYGIISEDYRKFGYETIGGKDIVYKFLKETKYNVEDDSELENIDINFNINSLPVIYQALNYFFYNKVSEGNINYSSLKASSTVNIIFYELIRRYIFSYLTMQKDFHLDNWEILYNEHSAYLSPMYDLELSMDESFYDERFNTSMKWSREKDIDIDQDFQEFINYSEENKKLVVNMHNVLNINDVIMFMNDIQNRGIIIDESKKEEIIKCFSEHYDKVDTMLYGQKNTLK